MFESEEEAKEKYKKLFDEYCDKLKVIFKDADKTSLHTASSLASLSAVFLNVFIEGVPKKLRKNYIAGFIEVLEKTY